ncbi:MAG: DUF721 domain-containing protein [Muribaculaceae bacterium]|nr:DUF721 domain-containing protein [Muribaculaceae bacterium]
MKRHEPLRIDAIIRKMVDATGLRPDLARHTVESMWPKVVGPHIAGYTGRIYVRERLLHVHITSAPLKEELGYAREALVERLNEGAGASVIDNIIFH